MAKRKKAAKSGTFNHKAHWKAYKELQVNAEKAWRKFHKDVLNHAPSNVIMKDHNNLLLILGECNYMARECSRMERKSRK
jgi:hypothetical protein